MYFLTTVRATITKLDQNIKQIELYKNCKIWGQKGCGLLNFGIPLYISGMAEDTNFKLNVQND